MSKMKNFMMEMEELVDDAVLAGSETSRKLLTLYWTTTNLCLLLILSFAKLTTTERWGK